LKILAVTCALKRLLATYLDEALRRFEATEVRLTALGAAAACGPVDLLGFATDFEAGLAADLLADLTVGLAVALG
jgi:hypothetical protein